MLCFCRDKPQHESFCLFLAHSKLRKHLSTLEPCFPTVAVTMDVKTRTALLNLKGQLLSGDTKLATRLLAAMENEKVLDAFSRALLVINMKEGYLVDQPLCVIVPLRKECEKLFSVMDEADYEDTKPIMILLQTVIAIDVLLMLTQISNEAFFVALTSAYGVMDVDVWSKMQHALAKIQSEYGIVIEFIDPQAPKKKRPSRKKSDKKPTAEVAKMPRFMLTYKGKPVAAKKMDALTQASPVIMDRNYNMPQPVIPFDNYCMPPGQMMTELPFMSFCFGGFGMSGDFGMDVLSPGLLRQW